MKPVGALIAPLASIDISPLVAGPGVTVTGPTLLPAARTMPCSVEMAVDAVTLPRDLEERIGHVGSRCHRQVDVFAVDRSANRNPLRKTDSLTDDNRQRTSWIQRKDGVAGCNETHFVGRNERDVLRI